MMSEIMEVPFPRAASRRLISFLTFQISMFFSASLGCSFCPGAMVAAVMSRVESLVLVGSRDFLVQRGARTSDVAADWRREEGGERAMRRPLQLRASAFR